jgi:hypothetical protein
MTRCCDIEGRATMARPLLFACVAMLSFLAMAATAQALPALILKGTNPISPGVSLTPRVHGEVEGVGTKSVPMSLGLRAAGPVSRAPEPGNTVRLYTQADCEGPVAGEGNAGELTGAGVQVGAPVQPDSVTTYYANQSKGLETSECSAVGLTYRHVATPPGAPVLESIVPASPANDNFPNLFGSADPEATVSIYGDPSCGTPVSSGSGAQFASSGIEVPVADNSETSFSAKATIAGFVSGCSPAPLVYREVTPPPDPGGGGGPGGGAVSPGTPVAPPPPPHLRTVPGGYANDNTPLVAGSAPGAQAVRVYADHRCGGPAVAKASPGELSAGLPIRVVDNDVTVFSAVSVAGGKDSACSDPVVYVEDSLAPLTRITMGPAAKTAKSKAIFRFMDTTGDAPGTTFFCRIDRRKWARCTSPLRLRNLRPKRYVVRVKAIDPAGNAESKGAKRGFKVIPHP